MSSPLAFVTEPHPAPTPSDRRTAALRDPGFGRVFTDHMAAIRYRDGKNVATPHTLNGTAITDRALLAVLENFQGEVPDVLLPYGAPASISR